MATLYLTKEDSILRKVDQRLRVTCEKQTLIDVPMIQVDNIVALARVTVTPFAVRALLEAQIPISFLNEYGRFLGRIEPAFSKNSLLRQAQYKASFDPAQTLAFAIQFVAGKLANQRTALVRWLRTHGKDDKVQKAIHIIKKQEVTIHKAIGLAQLRGFEGAAGAAYFSVLNKRIQHKDFSYKKRVRRPPTDPINALLSFGYALLANDITGLLTGIGFDPYQGYLHSQHYGRASLALDVMEEFRTIIVDTTVLSSINRGIFSKNSFEYLPGNIVYLNDKARKDFLRQYEERKRTEVQHPIFQYKATYLKCMELQGRLLAKTLRGEIESYPAFRTK